MLEYVHSAVSQPDQVVARDIEPISVIREDLPVQPMGASALWPAFSKVASTVDAACVLPNSAQPLFLRADTCLPSTASESVAYQPSLPKTLFIPKGRCITT